MSETGSRRSLPLRLLLLPAQGLITAFVLADAVARPIYRPVLDALSRMALMRRIEAGVARMPRYAILLVLAIPFFGVEPLKVLGVIWMGEGHVLEGLALLAFAYLASLVLIERIYRAGRDKLLTIAWFAACIAFSAGIRDRALAWVRDTAAWRAGSAAAATARGYARRMLASASGSCEGA